MAQQNGHDAQPRQQPDSYLLPPSYPSPLLQPSYAYSPTQREQVANVHRTGSATSYTSLDLPPIRSIEFESDTQFQSRQPSLQSFTPSATSVDTYYYQADQSPQRYSQETDQTNSSYVHATDYQLLPAQLREQRIMSGQRERKAIKRRTKTGCTTCRKRRIKCDETQPGCRNCLKSKKQCDGYDPILMQQYHAPIQPAPHNALASLAPPGTTYSPIPHGYAPATTSAFGTESPGNLSDYNSTVDPGLAAGYLTSMATENLDSVLPEGLRPEITALSANRYPHALPTSGNHNGKAKPSVKIEDLCMIGGTNPPTPKISHPITPETYKEMKLLYTREYARGIDQILETTWYTENGLEHLLQDYKLCQMFADMLELFRTVAGKDYEAMRMLPSTESCLIWSLMCLPRTIGARREASDTGGLHRDAPLDLICSRLDVMEHLITGQYLDTNPLPHTRTVSAQHNSTILETQHVFWSKLGRFVSLADHEQDMSNYVVDQQRQLDEILAVLRRVLQGKENRDVLYSMAVVRHLSARTAGITQSHSTGITDRDRVKLEVARKFLEDQAAGKGTTQVVQRLCGQNTAGLRAGGDSAGGNLAAGLVMMIIEIGSTNQRRWQGEEDLLITAELLLLYPALDMNIGNWRVLRRGMAR